MSDDPRPTELTPEEQEAFRSLSRERQPPDHLEPRVAEALKSRGLVRSPAAARQRATTRLAAAAVVALALGFAAGRFTVSPPPTTDDGSPRFMLLLYDTQEREAARTPEHNRQLAAEYGAWAQDLARAGHFLGGNSLKLDGRMLRRAEDRVDTGTLAADTAGEVVVGYFMIQAEDYDQALEIARDCPHLNQGGVLVRPVGHG